MPPLAPLAEHTDLVRLVVQLAALALVLIALGPGRFFLDAQLFGD